MTLHSGNHIVQTYDTYPDLYGRVKGTFILQAFCLFHLFQIFQPVALTSLNQNPAKIQDSCNHTNMSVYTSVHYVAV